MKIVPKQQDVDVDGRPYIILQVEPDPLESWIPAIAQFVVYWDDKKSKFSFYSTHPARRIPGVTVIDE